MIICCGEALIDMIPGRLNSDELAYIPSPGGAVFNTAVALGRLAEETSFFSGISTDMFGEKLISTLSVAGVDCDSSIRSSLPTTLAFVVLKNGYAEYTFYDENSAGKMIDPKELPQLPSVKAAHFGAISLIGEPCGLAYETLAMQLIAPSFLLIQISGQTS
jgi:fructokinase